jgi:ribosomal protein S15P/S13E
MKINNDEIIRLANLQRRRDQQLKSDTTANYHNRQQDAAGTDDLLLVDIAAKYKDGRSLTIETDNTELVERIMSLAKHLKANVASRVTRGRIEIVISPRSSVAN